MLIKFAQHLAVAAVMSCLVGLPTLSAAEEEAVEWGYNGDDGPASWGGLSEEFMTCSTGTKQSPIDIQSLETASRFSQSLIFHYRETPLKVLNNGHTIEVEYEPGSWMQVGSRIFELVQFHFHTPSEHTLEDGARFQMELHLVHRDSQGNLAVVGLLIREGAANVALAPIWMDLPNEEGEVIEDHDVEINAADFLPADVRAFHYSGSLTTPPCSENVRWFVVRQPIELSAEQTAAFRTALGESCCERNARPTQSLGERRIGRDILPTQR